MSKNVSEVLGASMSKVREMVDANTVVGDPIVLGEKLTLIPISKISFALASGGADFAKKNGAATGSFGGGAGCGVKITPVGMICLQDGRVRILPVNEPATGAAERIIEQLPELIDQISQLIGRKKSETSDITDLSDI